MRNYGDDDDDFSRWFGVVSPTGFFGTEPDKRFKRSTDDVMMMQRNKK
jgi:hypothetical protein